MRSMAYYWYFCDALSTLTMLTMLILVKYYFLLIIGQNSPTTLPFVLALPALAAVRDTGLCWHKQCTVFLPGCLVCGYWGMLKWKTGWSQCTHLQCRTRGDSVWSRCWWFPPFEWLGLTPWQRRWSGPRRKPETLNWVLVVAAIQHPDVSWTFSQDCHDLWLLSETQEKMGKLN